MNDLFAKIDRLKEAYQHRSETPLSQDDVDDVMLDVSQLGFDAATKAMRYWSLSVMPQFVSMLRRGKNGHLFQAYMNKLTASVSGYSLLLDFHAPGKWKGVWYCLYNPNEISQTYLSAKGRMHTDGRFILYTSDTEEHALESWAAFWMGSSKDFIQGGKHKRIKHNDGARKHFNNADFEIVNVQTNESIACSILCE